MFFLNSTFINIIVCFGGRLIIKIARMILRRWKKNFIVIWLVILMLLKESFFLISKAFAAFFDTKINFQKNFISNLSFSWNFIVIWYVTSVLSKKLKILKFQKLLKLFLMQKLIFLKKFISNLSLSWSFIVIWYVTNVLSKKFKNFKSF